jgi:predicted CopG family antitoxin
MFTILIMSSLTKRIPVSEPVWKELAEMRSAGQTYDELLEALIEERKKRRLAEDVKAWNLRKKEDYVPLSEIED